MSPAEAITTSGAPALSREAHGHTEGARAPSAPARAGPPGPPRGAAGAVRPGRRHVEPLQLWLLVDHDQVHAVATAEGMVPKQKKADGARGHGGAREPATPGH